MTQANPILGAGLSGLAYRAADNDGKQALMNHHKGPSAPAYAEAGMIWIDDAATPWLVKLHDGAGWIVLFSADAGTDRAIAALPAGAVAGSAHDSYGGNTDLSAVLPHDDTVPQSDEGTEILAVSITPKSASSILRVRFSGCGAVDSGAAWGAALFRDSASGAIAAATTAAAGGAVSHLSFVHEFAAGSTAETTLAVRVGPDAGTLRLNGTASARLLGGVMKASLVVEDIEG